MAKVLACARRFVTGKEEGASMVEYALLLTLITVAVIAAVTALGQAIVTQFNTVVGAL